MKPGDRVRVIPGPLHHPYTGWKIGRKGTVTARTSYSGKTIVWVRLDGDDEAEEWWVEYLEVIS